MLYPTELEARPFKLIRCVFRGALFSGRRRICAASDGLIARKERKANFSAEAPETRSGRAGQMWVGAALVIVALFPLKKLADPLHEGLRIVQVGQDHGIAQDVALEEAFVELLPTAECATGHIPRQME